MIGFAMLVGPGEGRLAVEALSDVLALYPEACVWVHEDPAEGGRQEVLARFARQNGRISLMANEFPQGVRGMAISMFRLFERIWQESPDIDLVIKIDPDTGVFRPGLVELAHRKFAASGPGMIGSYRVGPDGNTRKHSTHAKSIARDLITGKPPFYLGFLRRALFHGYIPGHTVLGGFYMLSGDTLRAVGRLGFWSSVPATNPCCLTTEDALVSMTVKAAGHQLIEINDPAHDDVPAWIVWRPSSIPWSAEQIVRKRFLAVHPLKDDAIGNRLRSGVRGALTIGG